MEIFATQLHEACRIFAAEKLITSCHTIIATATALSTTMTIAGVPVQVAITKNMSMVRSVGK